MLLQHAVNPEVFRGISINWARPQVSLRTGNSLHNFHGTQCPLAAVILAIKSSGGESVVFHYPPEPTYTSSQFLNPVDEIDSSSETDEENTDSGRRPPLTTRATDHLPTIAEREPSREVHEAEWTPSWHKILAIESSVLADIFTPQKTDEKFEVCVDDLVFLGMPVHLSRNGLWEMPSRTHKFADVFARQAFEDDSYSLAEYPATSTIPEKLDGVAGPAAQCPLTTFHLVFALQTDIDNEHRSRVMELYKHIVVPLTMALIQEQSRSQYVWEQCELIRSMKRKGEVNRSTITTLWHDILRKSNLAMLMQQTYDAISNGEQVHLVVNNRLPLSLAIPQRLTTDILPSERTTDHPFLNSALSFGLSFEMADPVLVPHYGLLLLAEADVVLRHLPTQSDIQLRTFIQAIRPTRSLYSLANTMQISVQEILQLSRCLLEWRCALPIPPLNPGNIYTVSPTADVGSFSRHALEFSHKFPDLPSLPAYLANLSRKACPFSTFIPEEENKAMHLEGLAWMFRQRWIMQVRTFVWVKIRAEFKAAVSREETSQDNGAPWKSSNDETLNGDIFQDSILADPYNATQLEKRWLGKLAAHYPAADAALFAKVSKYFNGKHAVEKIIVREGVDPRALRRLLESFDDDLIRSYSW